MEERNPICEIVERTGLTIVSTGLWQGIPYGWANNRYEHPKCIFAKYLFTFTDVEQWNKMYILWESFVDEIIEPTYFQLANDISWNLYWVSVLEDEQWNQLDPQKRITFSSNTEYTRNLVVPLERVAQFVPVGRIQPGSHRDGMRLPSENWAEQLEPKGVGFCLRGFSQGILDRYVKGEMIESATETAASLTGSRPLNRLISISIPQSFREHYYQKAWNIPLRQVNLLYGANGSGKTSLLSSIELAVTGEVRSLSGTEGAAVPDGIALQAEVDGQCITLNPPRSDAEKKQRERWWYQSRGSNRMGPQLKSLFHRFNYMSVEETFLFSSQQPDFFDIFSKILYGTETNDMWNNKSNYQNKLSRRIETLKQELEREQCLFEQRSEVPLADQAEFQAYLSASGLNLDLSGTAVDILTQMQKVQAEYDKVRDLAPILSWNQVQQKRLEQDEARAAIQRNREELQEKYRQANEQTEVLTRAEEVCIKEYQRCSDRWKTLQVLESLIPLLQFRVLYQEEIKAYQNLNNQLESWRALEARLQRFITDNKGTLMDPYPVSTHQIFLEMTELQKRHSALKDELDVVLSKIRQEELSKEQRTQLFSTLRAAGLELYQLQEGRHECPLCGTEGITQSRLLAHLEKEAFQADQQLQLLYLKKGDLEREAASAVSELKYLDQQQAAALDYENALQRLQQEFPDIKSFSELCQQRELTTEQRDFLQAKITLIKETLLGKLREIGSDSTMEDVLNCKRRLFDLALSADLALSPEDSNESLLDYLEQIKKEGVKRKEESAIALRQTQEERKRQVQAADTYKKELEQIRQQLEQAEKGVSQLKRMETFWEQIHEVTNSADLTGEAVHGMCEHICKLAHDAIEYTQYSEAKDSYLRTKEALEQRLGRCNTLKKELECLQAPELYAKQFIRQNVAQISQIFLNLHSPQEFSRLDITEDNTLVAFHGDIPVPVSHMSTGQRTALVVAVFFQMTLATPFAPDFLLLDEPVANIDDLNVLALMDFLRELVITHGKQLFFTTANRNVAKLFRRKFSFLQEDFQELYFLRENEHCLSMISRNYDQSQLLHEQLL